MLTTNPIMEGTGPRWFTESQARKKAEIAVLLAAAICKDFDATAIIQVAKSNGNTLESPTKTTTGKLGYHD
jgi:hypothetical protein